MGLLRIGLISGGVIGAWLFLTKKGAMKFNDKRFDTIYKWAMYYKIPLELAFGIAKLESNFDPNAYRDEPHIWERVKKRRSQYNWTGEVDNPNTWGSYGLYQILYSTAISIGYKGSSKGLYNINTNCKFGQLYIKQLYDKYNGNIVDVLSHYNSGKPFKNAPAYTRDKYIPLVLDRIEKMKSFIADYI